MVDAESEACDEVGGGVGQRGEVETEVFANATDCAVRAVLDVTDAESCAVDEVRAAAAGSST